MSHLADTPDPARFCCCCLDFGMCVCLVSFGFISLLRFEGIGTSHWSDFYILYLFVFGFFSFICLSVVCVRAFSNMDGLCMFEQVRVHVCEGQRLSWVSSSVSSHHILWGLSSSLTIELANTARVASQLAVEIPSLPSKESYRQATTLTSHLRTLWESRLQASGLLLVQQVL